MRRRIAATAVIAVGLMLALAGCTFLSPVATMIHYDASDGVGINVGDIQLRNAFVVSPDGTDANFVGAVINTSDKAETVRFQYTSTVDGKKTVVTDPVVVPAGPGPSGVISFGDPGVTQLVFRGADRKPGSLLRLFVQYGSGSGKSILIPVLDGSQVAYKNLAPSPTPSPTSCSITNAGSIVGCSTPTPTPTPTSTAAPVTN